MLLTHTFHTKNNQQTGSIVEDFCLKQSFPNNNTNTNKILIPNLVLLRIWTLINYE